jgi:hypothetical protein
MDEETQGGDSGAATATASQPASAPANDAALGQWKASAQPATPPPTQSPDLGSSAQIPKQDDQQQMQPPPTVITPMKKGGILGVIDDIAGALVGKTRPELATDQDGNKYIKTQTLTRGQQWMRIAGEAITGAAAGMAAGKGAGNEGKAAFAGVQQGQQMAQQQKQDADKMTDEVKQDKLEKANHQMLQMKMAENAWTLARDKVKATQEDIDFNDKQLKQLTDPIEKGGGGGRIIGTAAYPGDIAEILKVQPDVMKHLVQTGQLEIRNHLDKDGNVAGITAIMMPDSWGKTMLPAGTTGHTFNAVTGKIEEFKYSDPVMAGERDVHDAAAVTSKQAFDEKQRKAEREAADLADVQSETNARNKELPGKMAQTAAATNMDNAEAAAARAKSTPGAEDPEIAILGEGLAKGNLSEDQISNREKNKTAIQAYLTIHHPNLDQKSIFLDSGQRKQVNLANNAIHNLDDIQNRLQKRPDLLGKLQGRISQGKGILGTDDADLADIDRALDQYALASTGAHGVKAVQARADAKQSLLNGFKNGPAATKEAMNGARSSLQNLGSAGKPRGMDGTPYVYKAQPQQQAAPEAAPAAPGGLSFSRSAYLKANPQGNVNAAAQAAAAAGHPVVD